MPRNFSEVFNHRGCRLENEYVSRVDEREGWSGIDLREERSKKLEDKSADFINRSSSYRLKCPRSARFLDERLKRHLTSRVVSNNVGSNNRREREYSARSKGEGRKRGFNRDPSYLLTRRPASLFSQAGGTTASLSFLDSGSNARISKQRRN